VHLTQKRCQVWIRHISESAVSTEASRHAPRHGPTRTPSPREASDSARTLSSSPRRYREPSPHHRFFKRNSPRVHALSLSRDMTRCMPRVQLWIACGYVKGGGGIYSVLALSWCEVRLASPSQRTVRPTTSSTIDGPITSPVSSVFLVFKALPRLADAQFNAS
jgi:hypothetical protein